ncbi:ferredoxin--NADP reductase [Neptuniibacter caesariensis]|uniref:ferredoxin--NADP(+) reductase n=1 Tax=Neptuniibacter caesariensis TaxID=207954 RepID=A0A7U8GRE0_NEPCE|nr:ferredoxin--NADP reductase [Neptuniibacter caesariensis]EAR60148.1 hypothetical protein MED92_08832 [Oceanospirillum sp. MED92] [Neptuniibacter caesariensis]
MLMNTATSLTLIDKKYLSPRSLELSYQSDKPLKYLAGQFYSLRFPCGDGFKSRSYSVVNNKRADQNEEFTLSFVITLVEGGAASEYFRSAKPGSEIEASGPFGNLVLPRSNPKRFILIATGAGVAPYRSMLDELTNRLHAEPELKTELILGVRNREELLYGEEFKALSAREERFGFNAVFSRENNNLAEGEFSGHVTELYTLLEASPNDDMIYLCGHPQMIDDSVSFFENLGFSAANLKREKYLFSAI